MGQGALKRERFTPTLDHERPAVLSSGPRHCSRGPRSSFREPDYRAAGPMWYDSIRDAFSPRP